MLSTALALVLAITPHAIRAHVNFLASDALEGREAGTRGYDVAAAYVAAQFEAAGLEPAGDNGTYFQQVKLRTFRLDPASSWFAIDGTRFEHRKDILLGMGRDDVSDVDAPVVFAGFGISAPELGHDDYKGLDVRGKIVAILTGAPPRFPHSQRRSRLDRFHSAKPCSWRDRIRRRRFRRAITSTRMRRRFARASRHSFRR